MKYFAIGDLHGSVKPLKKFINSIAGQSKLEDENIMICLGDVGANYFMNERDYKFKQQLSKLPFTYFMIRGNHEERPSVLKHKNPSQWNVEIFFDGFVYVENDFPNIKYALDCPATYNIAGNNVLTIPGAYSVDKYHRIQNGWSWFEREQLYENEMELGREICSSNNWKFDFVFSHTCPVIYEPTDLFLSCVDQSTVDKTMERYLGELEHQLDYRLWLWGHYHKQRIYPHVDGIGTRIMLFEDVLDLQPYLNKNKLF